jgi:hypothetical protein
VSRAGRARNHQILAGLNYVIGRFEGPCQFICEVTVIDILFSSAVKVIEFKALPGEINDKKSVRTLKTVRTVALRYIGYGRPYKLISLPIAIAYPFS